jgi:alcohol dehydrogenase
MSGITITGIESLTTPFDFQLRTRMVRGAGCIDRLGELADELGMRRALLVTDPGIVAAGHVRRGMAALESAKIDVQLFEGAHENPTTDDIDAGLAIAQKFQPDLIVGLGGGSSMDCAKGINFVYSNGGRMQDYWGVGKASRQMLPMIAVPTTAGTGSEMQSFALISDATTHIKMACGDKKASCRVAILDPQLTLTQPAWVTALTGIDALSHALETYVTRVRNPISLMFSREAWRLLAGNFRRVLQVPDDLEARAAMQLGAAYAGVSIENSMLGASHALANPLTAVLGTPHGQAVGVMLPHVIRFNGQAHDAWYRELLSACEGVDGTPDPERGSAGLADFVSELLVQAGLKTELRHCGVKSEHLEGLAAAAAEQWTGTFNPRAVDRRSLLEIYQQAF